ncbi:hypothetical protein B0H63DRAFT_521854 [Podospora didyma]|uniref:Uncharacterized protein n=1 Tax=Podospora didyma TaxID=330526 RepID=A0AAE0U1R9_9PEZI|nr:hypothetical protein B0H63DRAFT_521854 [Podospora didyma]
MRIAAILAFIKLTSLAAALPAADVDHSPELVDRQGSTGLFVCSGTLGGFPISCSTESRGQCECLRDQMPLGSFAANACFAGCDDFWCPGG